MENHFSDATTGINSQKDVGLIENENTNTSWTEAYENAQQSMRENPVPTTVALGVSALSIGGIIATRGYLAKFLPCAGQEVLLVSKSHAYGNALKLALESKRHSVTWITGAESLNAFKSGAALGFDGRKVPLQLDKYKAAIVDSWISGDITGTQVIKHLADSKVNSISMRPRNPFNLDIRNEGAIASARPGDVLHAFHEGSLTVRQVIKRPDVVQNKLNDAAVKLDRLLGRF